MAEREPERERVWVNKGPFYANMRVLACVRCACTGMQFTLLAARRKKTTNNKHPIPMELSAMF